MIAAHRYAQAILDLSEQHKASDNIYQNAVDLSKIIKQNRELYSFLKSPLIKSDKKEKIFKQLFEKNIHPILTQLLTILCKRRREYIFPEILHAILVEYKKRNNIVSVELITAFQWDDELRKSIIEKIQVLKKSSKIELHEIVDENILGGFVLKTDNEQIDTSIQTQLNQLYQKFIQTNILN
ncbi:MAG: ATP synthase F1 subunit delta [Bacteroidia bacterium]|nr:ATP synthase F1 subunit delta [Bacteroidia bacterium]